METPPEDETLRDLSAVADELLEQAAELRQRWQELGDVLGVELEDTRVTHDADPDAVTPAPPAGRPHTDLDDLEIGVAVRNDYGAEDPDPVRVVVFDMMLSGRSRKEVKEYVRASFGSATDLSVVDEIFDAH